MNRILTLASGLIVALAVTPLLAADNTAAGKKAPASPESVVYDANSAFDFLSTLGGTWVREGNDHEHGSTSRGVTFRNSGAGSAIIETIYPGEQNEMVSVYHMDGDKLLMTHYCALGNAPILKFEKSDKPGEIRFSFYGGTNFDPKSDTHVHEGVFQVKDPNTFESSFVAWAEGKPQPIGKSVLKRKDAK